MLECSLRDALFRDACRIVEQILNDRALIEDNAPARPLEVIHQGRRTEVNTLFGTIKLTRRYYHHTKAGCGRHPLDEALDLVRGQTPGLARIICHASAQSASYQAAAADIAAYTGLELNGRNFGRLVEEIAPQLHQAQASLPPATNQNPPIPVLYVGSDGTGVPLRRKELAGVKGRQEDGTARTREVKLGCVFTQTSTDPEGNPIRDPDSTSYIGTFEDCRTHGALLRAEALRRGYTQAKTTVYLGDGAPWIWENARLNFPDAIQVLDFYHAAEHLGDLSNALLGAGPQAKELQSQWCHQLKAQSAIPIIASARTMLEQKRPHLPADALITIEREIAYFTTNSQRTRYGEFRTKGYFIGSGVVEAGCKTVVGHRLKQSGMFWSQRGGNDLLALRCLIMSDTFTQVWQARLPLLANQRSKAPRWSSKPN
jgi:hypothetical protein